MTNKELSQQIRKDLKTRGHTAKDISVSVRSGGYGDTYVKIKIKNPTVNRLEIAAVLYKYKDVDYDERAQEILQGGNTFVNVYYECGIFDDVAADWLPMARGAYESVEDGAKLFGDLYLSRSGFRTWVSEVNSIIKRDCNSAEHLAEFMYKYAQFGTIAV